MSSATAPDQDLGGLVEVTITWEGIAARFVSDSPEGTTRATLVTLEASLLNEEQAAKVDEFLAEVMDWSAELLAPKASFGPYDNPQDEERWHGEAEEG